MSVVNDDLKQIKKVYGEKMMHLARTLFPTFLETPGLLFSLFKNNIAPTRSLAYDLISKNLENDFKNYIYSLVNTKKEKTKTDKTPFELLDEAGYILYECKSESDIQKFRKYYKYNEELCTFRTNRNERSHVFFAVKKNVDSIKRENFLNPKRQDEYGTSVISIQFARGDINILTITNRYNNTVDNPDATFSNNLENIIPGLTYSFEKYYNLNIVQEINSHATFLTKDLSYVKANDDRYYKYSYEINNIYYCENNIIIDNGKVINDYIQKERYVFLDYFILDKKEKKIFLYDSHIQDSFLDSINDIGEIKQITSTKDKEIIIEYENNKQVKIILNKDNKIISYQNDYTLNIKDNFMNFNNSLINLKLSNVESIENNFLTLNTTLKKINIKNTKQIGNFFLSKNTSLKHIDLEKLEIIGNYFLANSNIMLINVSKVKTIGDYFLVNAKNLPSINLENVEVIGSNCLRFNNSIKNLNLNKVKTIGDYFMANNNSLININLENLKYISNYFLYSNNSLKDINLENVLNIGNYFLYSNNSLLNINLSSVKSIGDYFLYGNNSLNSLNLENIQVIRDYFMSNTEVLTYLNAPNVLYLGNNFLTECNSLENYNLPGKFISILERKKKK